MIGGYIIFSLWNYCNYGYLLDGVFVVSMFLGWSVILIDIVLISFVIEKIIWDVFLFCRLNSDKVFN